MLHLLGKTRCSVCSKVTGSRLFHGVDIAVRDRPGAVIEVPVKMMRSQEKKRLKFEEKRRKFRELYGVDKRKARVIVACKRKELNHYDGQRYPPNKIPLVSDHWTKSKYVGDYFVVNSFGKNPSVLSSRLEDGPTNFDGYGLAPEVLRAIYKVGHKQPTLIQHFGIPACMSGRNILLAGETGSGKTLAYTAAFLHHLLTRTTVKPGPHSAESIESSPANVEAPEISEHFEAALSVIRETPRFDENISTPRALVLTPGRELATQTCDMIRKLASETNLRIEHVGAEEGNLRLESETEGKQSDVLVGTPGVLQRLRNMGKLSLDGLSHVIVDEADTLLDDSFSNLIIDILAGVQIQMFSPYGGSQLPGAQLILCSATFPRDMETILEGVVDSTNITHVKTTNLHRVMPHVTQKFWRLSEPLKPEKLLELVKWDIRADKSVLVFARDLEAVDWVHDFLQDSDVDCGKLRGKMNLNKRQETFDRFQKGELKVLVASDIASRGLDTAKVQHVINFDFPRNLSDYIHRVGRVGRVGAKFAGHVTSFVQRKYEVRMVQIIEESIRKSKAVPYVDANIKANDDLYSQHV